MMLSSLPLDVADAFRVMSEACFCLGSLLTPVDLVRPILTFQV